MGRKKRFGSINPKISAFEDTAYFNNVTYLYYYNYLKNLAMNRFEWNNVPDSINIRWAELNLFERGYVLYFNDVILGDLMLPCTIGGGFNVYNIPIQRRAFSASGYNAERTIADSVIVYSNYLHIPDEMAIRMFAYRLYESTRATDVNIKQQKFPYLLLMDDSQRLTYENMLMKYDGNQHVILLNNNFNKDDIQSFPTTAPFVADRLEIETHQILNAALSYLGIENGNVDKKERLVSNEVTANYGLIEASRNVWLNSRQQAADEINAMFGTDITVTFKSDMYTKVNKPDEVYKLQGGVINEPIHDPSPLDSRESNT